MNKRIPFAYETSSLILNVWEDETEGHIATISDLFSNMRSQGHATGLLRKVLSYTDKAGLTVFLEAKQYGHPIGLDSETLQRFYEKFGFVKEPGTGPERFMRRAPSQDLQGSL